MYALPLRRWIFLILVKLRPAHTAVAAVIGASWCDYMLDTRNAEKFLAVYSYLARFVTSFEHRGPSCLLTLTCSTSPPLDQFPLRVCSCPLCTINRL